MNKKKYVPNGRLRAKLSFDDGFAEDPIYTIKANTNEKLKGIHMVELIGNNFGITSHDLQLAIDKRLRDWDVDSMQPTDVKDIPQLTRDEKGNLASPFRSKRKLT